MNRTDQRERFVAVLFDIGREITQTKRIHVPTSTRPSTYSEMPFWHKKITTECCSLDDGDTQDDFLSSALYQAVQELEHYILRMMHQMCAVPNGGIALT
jgi:hypothetical protein